MSGATFASGASGALAAAGLVEVAVLVAAMRPRIAPWAAAAALLARLGRRIGVPAAPLDLEQRLAAAGHPLGLRAGDAMAVKAALAALGLALALPLAALAPGRLGLLVSVAIPAGAFLAPDAWLRRRARARERAMELELPDLLDLLRVALAAGLPLERALAAAARRDRGLLAREWRTAAAQVELGLARAQALDGLVERCPCPGVATLVRALDRAARHGAPLADALSAQARDARAARARRIVEQAGRAAPQIQLVVALLLVPSVLLLVAAALLAALLS